MKRPVLVMTLVVFLVFGVGSGTLWADGTETLGPPSVPITPGTGVIAAGVGLAAQRGDISFNVPAGATVEQVLLYWEGQDDIIFIGADETSVNGNLVTGTQIGGPIFWRDGGVSTTYRADITGLGLVGPGANGLTVEGLTFTRFANGAGVLVIVDDGTSPENIEIRDGNDLAFIGWTGPPLGQDTTVPQTFTFAASSEQRTATLSMFVSAVSGTNSSGGTLRPSAIDITVGGVTDTYDNLLDSVDGQEWDTVVLDVTIPPGETALTVQVLSVDNLGTGALPASLTWNVASLSVPPPPTPEIEIEKFTNGYDADDANGFPIITPPPGPFEVGDTKVPLVTIGDDITWTYRVKNTGSETLENVTVTDSQGVMVICPQDTLNPGEEMICMAMGMGLDLANTTGTVEGCGAQGQGMTQPTYENLGTVVATSVTSGVEVTDDDPSHYCNPPDVMIEKFTNGHDGDNANGIPAPDDGGFQVGAATVAEIPSNGDITWTYRVTNTGTETLENVMVTDSRGVAVSCPQTTLLPGESMDCTATGFAEDLAQTGGDVDGCGSGTGDTRPTYENLGEVVATSETSAVEVTDNDPSHYCNPLPPPPCGLMVEKGCEVPPIQASLDEKCDGKLKQFTMIWDGADGTQISGVANDDPDGLVDNGDEVTFFGPFSDNDVVVTINGVDESTFHVSCSDRDMDGTTETNEDQEQQPPLFARDCGKFQGNGKGDAGVNQWLLEGFVDNSDAVLDCTMDGDVGASNCEFQAVSADCDFPNENPDNLTWQYTGGGCSASDNAQKPSGDLLCTGSIDGSLPVTITDDDGNVFNVEPGGVFTTTRDASKVFTLSNAGGTEVNGRHVSCSQPLQAGDVYGSLTLVGLDGAGLGTEVVYSYLVSNEGATEVSDISVSDDQLGPVGSIASLAPGSSETLTATAFLTATTINIATADGTGAPGAACSDESNPVLVTVSPPPPCDVSIAFKELKDDAIKWTLSNDSLERKATLGTLTLVFPPAYGRIREVKLDGTIFKADDSVTFPDGVPSGQTIGQADWTNLEVAKRQLDQGENRTLEVKFTQKSQDFGASDFTLTLTFKEGCGVDTP